MGKNTKLAKGRLDKYYWLAKEQGYRSRAAFKLIQINKKYDFLSSSRCVIDLCAAPGGWMQVCQKYMPMSSLIIGVDLDPIRKVKNCIGLQEDITTQKCRDALKREMHGWKADAVLNDGAPNVGGAWAKDSYSQAELGLHSLKLAAGFLREGGWFVTKVFRSTDYNALMWVCQQLFQRVEPCKPASSRAASAEIFLVCSGYLAPTSIDPRLFQPNMVFQEAVRSQGQVIDVFAKTQPSKYRGGYEDDAGQLMGKTTTIDHFIESEKPVEMLGQYHSFTFDADSLPLGTAEIQHCLKDLRVLGKKDFKRVLTWRAKVKKLREEEQVDASDDNDEDDDMEDAPEPLNSDEEEALEAARATEELDVLTAKLAKREQNKKRKRRAEKLKAKRRLGLSNQDAELVENIDEPMFALGQIKDKTALELVADAKHDDFIPNQRESESSESSEDSGSSDSEENEDAFAAQEESIDHMYEEYAKRRGLNKKRTKLGMTDEKDHDNKDQWDDFAKTVEDDDTKGNSVLSVSFKMPSSADAKMKRWMGDDLLAGVDSDDDSSKPSKAQKRKASTTSAADEETTTSTTHDVKRRKTTKGKFGVKTLADDGDSSSSEDDSENDADDESGEDASNLQLNADGEFQPYRKALQQEKSKGKKKPKDDSKKSKKSKKSKTADDEADDHDDQVGAFEEVVAVDDWSSSDSDAVAEVLAIGQKMQAKRARSQLVNDSYNRYSFQDPDDVPEWFTHDERNHNKPNVPITKAEVDEIKAQFKGVNKRTIKKVAEAKARKKYKAMKRFDRLKQSAEHIMSSREISSAEKEKVVLALMKKGKRKDQQSKHYMVTKGKGRLQSNHASKGRKEKGSKTVVVDKRMKADKRGAKNANNKKEAGVRKRKGLGSRKRK